MREILRPLRESYAYTWNSANEWDSYGQFTAEALDSSGNVLAISAPVPVRIANGTYTMQQTSPSPVRPRAVSSRGRRR